MQGAASGVTADLSQMFGRGGNVTSDAAGQTVTYSPTAATTNATAVDQRRAAAASVPHHAEPIGRTGEGRALAGHPNLLTGGEMTVNLDEKAGSRETLRLSSPLDVKSLGFAWNAAAGTSSDAAADFAADPELKAAIDKVKAALDAIGLQQRTLAGQSSMLNTRIGFNTSLAGALGVGADLLTAADMTAEAAALASQDTRRSFASNNLSVTNSVEQGLVQMLR